MPIAVAVSAMHTKIQICKSPVIMFYHIFGEFAPDLAPDPSPGKKKAKDAADGQPPMNQCWFAPRVFAVKKKYAMSVDGRERDALADVLCDREVEEAE